MNEEMKAKRDREWSELSDSEKIERMHDVVKNLQREYRLLSARVSTLRYHEHGEGGKILIPFNAAEHTDEEVRPSRIGIDWF